MTTQIAKVMTAEGQAAFHTDDQAAIRAGARRDGASYLGQPVTRGYRAIRQPAEALSVLLVLSDGQVAQGDCVGVQYSGVAGRQSPFAAENARKMIEEVVTPAIVGQPADSFRTTVNSLADLPHCAAVAYGVSQALLDAAALATGRTAAEVIVDEYDTGVALRGVPLMAQSGEDRYHAVDAMILKGVEALPHGLINNAAELVGCDGQLLIDYVRWVSDRVRALRPDAAYNPMLHFDTYGTPGSVFGTIESLAGYLARLVDAEAADMIHVKAPDLGGLDQTVLALRHCTEHVVKGYCCGSCTETVRSAQLCVHVAMASAPINSWSNPAWAPTPDCPWSAPRWPGCWRSPPENTRGDRPCDSG